MNNFEQAKKDVNLKKIEKKEIKEMITEILSIYFEYRRCIPSIGMRLYEDIRGELEEVHNIDIKLYTVERYAKQIFKKMDYVHVAISTQVLRSMLSDSQREYLIHKEYRDKVPLGSYQRLNNCHSGVWVPVEDIDWVKRYANIYQKGAYFCICLRAGMEDIDQNGQNKQLKYLEELEERIREAKEKEAKEKEEKEEKEAKEKEEKEEKEDQKKERKIAKMQAIRNLGIVVSKAKNKASRWVKGFYDKFTGSKYPYQDTYRFRVLHKKKDAIESYISPWEKLKLNNPDCNFTPRGERYSEYRLE